jgi:hypothetical protein
MPSQTLSERAAQHAARNARTYQTDEGLRLNVQAIEKRFDITEDTFYRRQRNGWPSLGGKKLSSKMMTYTTDRTSGDERTFLENDVQAALNPDFEGSFPDCPGGPRVSLELAGKLLADDGEDPVCDMTFAKWEKGCPYLDDAPLMQTWERSPVSCRLVKTCARADIDSIKARLEDMKTGRFTDCKVRTWLNLLRTLRELTVGRKRPSRWQIGDWVTKGLLTQRLLPVGLGKHKGPLAAWFLWQGSPDEGSIESLKRTRLTAPKTPPANWRPRDQIAESLDVGNGVAERTLLSIILKEWRKDHPESAGQFGTLHPTWFHDAANFQEFRAGRSLHELVAGLLTTIGKKLCEVLSDEWTATADVLARMEHKPSDDLIRKALNAEARAGAIELMKGKPFRWRKVQAEAQDPREANGKSRRRTGGGRQRSADTAAVYKLCYDMREAGAKYVVIQQTIKAKLGVTVAVGDIRLYAKRHAKRKKLHFAPRT